jgi:hypothetical protein
MSVSKTLVLEFDDLHWLKPENCLNEIEFLVNKYPSIKLSFFTVPNLRNEPIARDEVFCNELRAYITKGNLELNYHGFNHSTEEFKYINYDQALQKIVAATEFFNIAGLPVKKVFRGPHWGLNRDSIKALQMSGFTHIYNHEDYKFLEVEKPKFVYYNWNLKDPYVLDKDLIIGHGHTHRVCENGIQEVIPRICAYIDHYNPSFLFTSEV